RAQSLSTTLRWSKLSSLLIRRATQSVCGSFSSVASDSGTTGRGGRMRGPQRVTPTYYFTTRAARRSETWNGQGFAEQMLDRYRVTALSPSTRGMTSGANKAPLRRLKSSENSTSSSRVGILWEIRGTNQQPNG